MKLIDLRSDTVTHPTPAMREAMAKAVVGDDVYDEDPTVNQLQEMAANLLGKEAGLFVPSGTMGNLASILAHCGRGDEVILGNKAHTVIYEAGGISALGGIHSRQLPNQKDGTISLEDLQAAIRPEDVHQPPTRLIGLENTHNRCGGVALSPEYGRAVRALADQHNLLLHLDGARIFNAAVAQGVSAKVLAEPFDSVTFCLSKGLCAPIGAVIVGNHAFINRAKRIRKQLGGGMRQVGIVAAAGIVALETMIDRLAEDHARAKQLAKELARIPGIVLDPGTPYTNMLFFNLSPDFPRPARWVIEKLKDKNVLVGDDGERRFRLVTHYWIEEGDIAEAVRIFKEIMAQ